MHQVTLETGIMEANEHLAAHNRELYDEHGVSVINLMSAPGAGKTSVLEQTIRRIRDRYRLGVIEGDLMTTMDDVGKDRRRDNATTFRVMTAADEDLPYDAAVLAEVRVIRDPWHHVLSHPTFAIAHVFGEIESVELNCRENSQQLSFEPGAEWNVPAGWEPCSVSVEAGRGTTFSLYEFNSAGRDGL